MGSEKASIESFESLFLEYSGKVFELCLFYTHDYHTSKDLTQNIFLDLWRRRKTFDDRLSLEKYLTRCAKYQVFNYFRYQQKTERRPADEMPEMPAAASNPELAYQYQELETCIRQLIASLKDPCRTIFCLSRFELLTHRAISIRLGISVRAVEFHIGNALKTLRKGIPSGSR